MPTLKAKPRSSAISHCARLFVTRKPSCHLSKKDLEIGVLRSYCPFSRAKSLKARCIVHCVSTSRSNDFSVLVKGEGKLMKHVLVVLELKFSQERKAIILLINTVDLSQSLLPLVILS